MKQAAAELVATTWALFQLQTTVLTQANVNVRETAVTAIENEVKSKHVTLGADFVAKLAAAKKPDFVVPGAKSDEGDADKQPKQKKSRKTK